MWTSILWLFCFLPLIVTDDPTIAPPAPITDPPDPLTCDHFKTPEDALKHLRSTAEGIKDDDVVRVLLGCQSQFNFTIKQINRFVKHRRNTFYEILARRVPLCVLSEDDHPELGRFKETLEKFESDDKNLRLELNATKEIKHYPLLNVWEKADKGNMNLENIEFRKIETPDKTFGTNVLQQWFSVKLHFSSPVAGVIVQSIEGFLGLPFGEFRADFNCANDPPELELTNPTKFSDLSIIPCKYRPRTSFVHPHIFVVGGHKNSKPDQSYNDIVFHFNFINAPCHDVAAFQFMIIAIDGTNPGVAFLTPVYELKLPSSYDGVPSYYYPDPRDDWKKNVKCTTVKLNSNCLDLDKDCSSGDKANPIQCDLGLLAPCSNSIIPYSRIYDDCIMGKDNTRPEGDETCPPGPFLCTKFPETKIPKEWIDQRVANLELLRHCGSYIPRQVKVGVKDVKYSCEDNANDELFWEHFVPEEVTLPDFTTPVQVGRRRRRRRRSSDVEEDDFYSDVTTQATITDHDEELHELVEYDEEDDTDTATNAPVIHHPAFEVDNRQKFKMEFQKLGIQHYKFNKRLHGLLMIIAFLVINPISTYLARYFKETPAMACWGIPRWLMAHIILSMISITIIWLGIVACLGNAGRGVVDCDGLLNDGKLNTLCTDHQNSIVHMLIGTLTVAAFHMSAASAWSRPRDSRGMYMTTHSFSGYFTFIGATASSIFVNSGVCFEITAEACLLFIINLILWCLECCVQLIQDKRLRIKDRHFFPMLEGLSVEESCPPCHCFKIFFFLIAILVHLGGGALVVSSYVVMNNEDLYVDRNYTEDTYLLPGLFFQDCKILNYMMVISKARD